MPNDAAEFVTVLWEARAKEGREAEMKALIEGVITASRADPGCIDYEFYVVEGDPRTFIAYERWVSRAALDAHIQAPHMQNLVPGLLEVMEGGGEDGLRLLRAFRPRR